GATPGECTAGSASSPDTIQFSVTNTLSLVSPLPTLSTPMTIRGPGVKQLVIVASGAFRVFTVTGAGVSISGLRIQNGQPSNADGGCILNSGTLSLRAVWVLGGALTSSGNGGGIANSGDLSIF